MNPSGGSIQSESEHTQVSRMATVLAVNTLRQMGQFSSFIAESSCVLANGGPMEF